MKTIRTGTASQEHIQGLPGEQPLPCSSVVGHISISENPHGHDCIRRKKLTSFWRNRQNNENN